MHLGESFVFGEIFFVQTFWAFSSFFPRENSPGAHGVEIWKKQKETFFETSPGAHGVEIFLSEFESFQKFKKSKNEKNKNKKCSDLNN